MVLAVWAGSTDGETAWHEDAGRLTFVSGRWRVAGEPWPTDGAAAVQFAHAVADHGLDGAVDRSVGSFTAVSMAGDRAWATCDPIGTGFLYEGRSREVTVYSSRAELAARAISSLREPTRDLVAACRTIYSPYSIGDRSGFEGVRLLPEATTVLVGPEDPEVGGMPAPWLRPGALADSTVDGLLDTITDAIADEL